MSVDNLWLSHDLIRDREVKIEGAIYRHRRCQRCRRNFVIAPGSAEWAAVHVGIFEFISLDAETNQKWLSEPCPSGDHDTVPAALSGPDSETLSGASQTQTRSDQAASGSESKTLSVSRQRAHCGLPDGMQATQGLPRTKAAGRLSRQRARRARAGSHGAAHRPSWEHHYSLAQRFRSTAVWTGGSG